MRLLLFRDKKQGEYVVIVEDDYGQDAAIKEADAEGYRLVTELSATIDSGSLSTWPTDRPLVA